MSCCAPGAEMALDLEIRISALPSSQEVRLASRSLGGDLRQTDLSVPTVHCAACIQTIETALAKLDRVEGARVNLSTKRVSVRWRGEEVPSFVAALGRLGYDAHLFDPPRDLAEAVARLRNLPGIGEWTAQYIAMRALGESDAFLAGDVAVQRRFASDGRRPTASELLVRAERWRPWRAYAVLHLWMAGKDAAQTSLLKETYNALAA